jgi:hypothetical protein
MDILGTARKFEAVLSRRFERAAERVRTPGPPQPLEVAHAIVEAVAEHVEPGGRGRHVFPYHRVKVSMAAPTKDARAQLEAVIDGSPSLAERIAERLGSAGCDTTNLDVRTSYVTAATAHWTDPSFNLELLRLNLSLPSARERPARSAATLELTIEHGTAERASYTFSVTPINLGRCAEICDSRHRLIRSNHVAFVDAGGEVNASVSRRHAHVAYDAASGQLRVCDDRSEHGTGILRGVRLITVPAGARGIRIQSGDVIVLGQARVRVTIVTGG